CDPIRPGSPRSAHAGHGYSRDLAACFALAMSRILAGVVPGERRTRLASTAGHDEAGRPVGQPARRIRVASAPGPRPRERETRRPVRLRDRRVLRGALGDEDAAAGHVRAAGHAVAAVAELLGRGLDVLVLHVRLLGCLLPGLSGDVLIL